MFFLTCLKRVNPEENLDLFKQLCLIKPVKREKFNKNSFSTKSEPHTAKLCFSLVLENFLGNSQRTSLISQKIDISEKSTEKLRKFVFLKKFEKGQMVFKI